MDKNKRQVVKKYKRKDGDVGEALIQAFMNNPDACPEVKKYLVRKKDSTFWNKVKKDK